MKFCAKLCQHINFEPASIQPCCNVHNTVVPSMPYNGGDIDMNRYMGYIQECANTLQTDTKLCKGCPDLQEIDASRGGFNISLSFEQVLINMHRHICNCKCVYCNLWKKPKKTYSVLPGLKSLARQNVIDPDCWFSWGGGEPSILPEFENAAQWITSNGWRQNIFTNAIKYSPAISELLRRLQGRIEISLDSASPEVFKDIKQVDKFDSVISNIKRYVQESQNPGLIVIKYIIFEKNNNISEIGRFLNLCDSLHIGNVRLSFNFLEANSPSGVSQKTLLAAAFFIKRCGQLGLECTPFYINEKQMEIINNIMKDHF